MRADIWTRHALAIAIVALLAQSAEAQRPTPAAAVEPGAVKALNAMAVYLRNLKSFEVESATTTDNVQDDGQLVQQCGTTWYQPQFAGTTATYVVVTALR